MDQDFLTILTSQLDRFLPILPSLLLFDPEINYSKILVLLVPSLFIILAHLIKQLFRQHLNFLYGRTAIPKGWKTLELTSTPASGTYSGCTHETFASAFVYYISKHYGKDIIGSWVSCEDRFITTIYDKNKLTSADIRVPVITPKEIYHSKPIQIPHKDTIIYVYGNTTSRSNSKSLKIEVSYNIIICGRDIATIHDFIDSVTVQTYLDLIDKRVTMKTSSNSDEFTIFEYKTNFGRSDTLLSPKSWVEGPLMVQKTLDNLFLSNHVYGRIMSNISSFSRLKTLNLKLGIPHKRGLIFNGPPGTGKTACAYALSHHLKMKLYKIPTNIGGRSELNELIPKIPGNSIVLFDEMDKILDNILQEEQRDKSKENDRTCEDIVKDLKRPSIGEMILSLLAILDGYNSLDSCIIILTSNSIDSMDRTLIRPGRIDEIIEFSYITSEQLENILHFVFPEVPLEKVRKDVEKIVKNTLSTATILFNCVAIYSEDYEACVSRISEISKRERIE